MEVNEGPIDPTDPVEDLSPVHNAGAESEETPAAGMNTPPRSDGTAPNDTSLPSEVPGRHGCDLNGESQKDSLRSEEINADEAEERFSLAEKAPGPQEMDATPAITPPLIDEKPGMEERARVAEYIAPTPERYVTPNGLLSTTGSPSQPRASPKRKQLSSPEGSEIAAGLVSVVKRHCSSMSEYASSP